MSKSRKCVKCAVDVIQKKGKEKTNKLAYTDYPKIQRGQCQPEYVPKIEPCGTRIRYCTAQELKLISGKQFCECPQAKEPMKKGQFFMSGIRNALKAALVFAVGYISYDFGLWGDTTTTENTFASICEAMPCRADPCKSYDFDLRKRECKELLELLKVPTNDPCSCQDPTPIKLEKCAFSAKQFWNHAVIFTFDNLVNGPERLFSFVSEKWNEFSKKECKKECEPMVINEKGKAKDQVKLEDCELRDDYDDEVEVEMTDEDFEGRDE